MTQHNSLNAKLSDLQRNQLKQAINNKAETVLRFSSNMIRNPNDKTNFTHKLLLINTQIANLRKNFAYKSSIDIRLSKTQLSKIRSISW